MAKAKASAAATAAAKRAAAAKLAKQQQQQRADDTAEQHSARLPEDTSDVLSTDQDSRSTSDAKDMADMSLASVSEADETADFDQSTTDTAPGALTPRGPRASTPDEADQPAGNSVVVCVRVRPAPSPTDSAESAPWTVTEATSTVEATEHHPSIAKRGTSSSAPLPAASASSSFLNDAAARSTSGDSDTYKYTFDAVLPPTSSSLDALYTAHLSPIVHGAVQGYNGTVFAYGQTGSGKTYTMSGGGGEQGIIGRAIQEVFDRVERETSREFLLRVSYLEIYNESLRDLLVTLPSSGSFHTQAGVSMSSSVSNSNTRPASPTKGGFSHQSAGGTSLRIQEHPTSGKVSIAGLREEVVTSPSDILSLLERGQAARHQAATDWNERSSRSHCVATLTIESREKDGGDGVRVSALNLIDLAGSERAATEKERRKEGAYINKSLLTLGSVISKLSAAASSSASAAHIPYRDSKLTRLLQTSLSGNARVAVLLTMSPLSKHAVEGLSTLKFGRRCKMIKLRARRGEVREGDEASEALLKKYKREVEKLRAKLEEGALPSTSSLSSDQDDTLKSIEARRQAAESEVELMDRRKAELRAQMEHLTRLILTGKAVATADGGLGLAAPERPTTPTRQRGRMSECGTPGTPSKLAARSESPRKRALGASLRTPSQSFRLSDPPVDDSTKESRPFAKEAEVASLRRKLASAIEEHNRSEEALRQEVQALKARAADREAELQATESQWRATDSARSDQHSQQLHDLSEQISHLRKDVTDLTERHATAQQELEATRIQGNTSRGELEAQLRVLQERLDQESTLRQKAEETLARRPETEDEIVEDEFNELVQHAKQKDPSGRQVTSQTVASVAPVKSDQAQLDAQRALEVRAEGLDKREKSLVERDADLVRREVRFKESETQRSREQETEIADLRKQLFDARADQRRAEALPASPSRLREALAVSATTTPTKTPGVAALTRGGSVREYRRYRPPTVGSMTTSPLSPSSTTCLPALALASPSTGSHAPALLEAALRNEREEIARLNEVIQSQRMIMSTLEGSVTEWQKKMQQQQEIIRLLMQEAEEDADDDGKSRTSLTSLPTPPMQEGENAPPLPAAHRQLDVKGPISRPTKTAATTPLRSSSRSFNASPPPATTTPVSRGNSLRSDDFLKRRSAFLVDSSSGAGGLAKVRGGSAMPLGSSSSPYYGAHTFNRPPGPSTPNHGLGLTAPSSPTKGSGLWASHGGPDPLPLPESTASQQRRRRRITIEHELEALKSGTSPKVEARTRHLLDSPKKQGNGGSNHSRFDSVVESVADDKKGSRDWYI